MSDRSRFHTLLRKGAASSDLPRSGGAYLYVRASNGQWSLQACSCAFPGGGLVDPLLRASNEALPRACVPRAGGRPARLSLLLQSAAEVVPREALKREGARFLW